MIIIKNQFFLVNFLLDIFINLLSKMIKASSFCPKSSRSACTRMFNLVLGFTQIEECALDDLSNFHGLTGD